ncbi:MAG: zinc-binding dehydrogenase [Armatimonadota bacterium]|nr:zinc-binding dehydrogenase [Armatimonadota bacterium]
MTNPQITFIAPRHVEIQDADVPPLGPHQIRVRTRRSLISAGTEGASYVGRQWHRADGSVMPRYPTTPGYSNAGVVEEVGESVTRLQVGDRVVSSSPHRLLSVLPEEHPALWQIPGGVSDEQATFCVLGCTVLNGVRMAHPQLGEEVAVIGLGVLGQLACRYLSLAGAGAVIGLDLDDFRLELASEAGVITHAVNPRREDAPERVRELTGGRGADIVYEVTGLTETYDTAFALARRFGTVVALGSARWPAEVDMMALHLKALTCVGAIVSAHPEPGDPRNRWDRHANGRLFLRLAAEDALALDAMITHRLPFSEPETAYLTAIGEGEPCLGVILQWPEA